MDKKIKQWLAKWVERIINLFLYGCGFVVLWLLVQVFCLASFHIPSDSMEPGLWSGDVILVNKWTYGARLFNVMQAIDRQQVNIKRLPGIGKIQRNDVVVFNNPCPKAWRRMEMDIMQYYVKRCVALPGDTFSIENGRYKVRGYTGLLGCTDAQERFRQIVFEQELTWTSSPLMRVYPGDSLMGWNALNFGPFYIPRINDTIVMNTHTVKLYRDVIEWEQKEKLSNRSDSVYLGDSLIRNYRFLKNYYFMTGDKVENSKDSRYWGLLPEEYIVGKAWRIWQSVDARTGNIRWNRIWKKIE